MKLGLLCPHALFLKTDPHFSVNSSSVKIFDEECSYFSPHVNRGGMIRTGLTLLSSLRTLFPGNTGKAKLSSVVVASKQLPQTHLSWQFTTDHAPGSAISLHGPAGPLPLLHSPAHMLGSCPALET